jgi:hypothetical protein
MVCGNRYQKHIRTCFLAIVLTTTVPLDDFRSLLWLLSLACIYRVVNIACQLYASIIYFVFGELLNHSLDLRQYKKWGALR